MSEGRRKRRGIFDLFDEEDFLFGRETLRGESGYSISVTYDSAGKPVVRVETRGEVDVAALRRDIEQRYPGARIEGLEKKPLIRIVGEEEGGEERERKEGKPEEKKKKAEKGGRWG
ncbi:MAG: hypothetical protein QW231_06900 [Candidatus Bathyarchaeia archaeon]